MGALRVDWMWAFATIVLSHIWYGGWSLVALPRFVYYVCFGALAFCLVGLVKRLQIFRHSRIFAFLVLYSFFWIGQMYHIVMLFVSKGSSTAMGGWYLHSLVWVEVIVAFVGIAAIIPRPFRRHVLTIAVLAILAIDLYGTHFVALPYYAHSDTIAEVHISQLVADKPQCLDGLWAYVLWVLYFISSVAVAFIASTGGVSEVVRSKLVVNLKRFVKLTTAVD